MGLTVRFQGGPRAGEVLAFDDSHERISLGRDSTRCQVVFPASETQVGREHCELVRELGRYRLVLNQDNLVRINGQTATDGQELGPSADLQLGPAGPKLVIETMHDKNLPSTSYQGKRPGQPTMIRTAGQSAQTGRRVAVTAVVLLAIGGAIGYWAWHRHDEDLKKNQQGLADTQSQVAAIVPKVTALNKLTEEQQTLLKGVTSEVAGVEKKLKDLEPRLAEKVQAASPSVYLVMIRDAEGQEYAQATAWVVDKEKGILATNGHVAELFPSPMSGSKLIVRSNTAPSKTYVVKSTTTHPGYAQFQRLWGTYDPTKRRGPLSAESVSAAGPACDVALLYLQDYEGLADALPLAPPEVLKALGPGYAVGYVGYPMEGLVLGGVNAKSPTPTRHLAYISSVTSFFGDSNVDSAEKLLVQHALPSAGGASGSPIINRDGQVVAVLNATNVIGMAPRARIGSSANIAFGQRSDLVRELLDKTADKNQVARLVGWTTDIAKNFKPRDVVEKEVKKVRDRIANNTVAGWEEAQVGFGDYKVTDVNLVDTIVSGSPPSEAKATLAANGPCFVIAYDVSGDNPVFLRVTEKNNDTETQLPGLSTNFPWARIRTIDGHDKASVNFTVASEAEGSKIVVRAVQAQRVRIDAKVRLQKVLDDWTNGLSKKPGKKIVTKLISESSDKLPNPLSEGQPAINKVELMIADAGNYFAYVSTAGDDQLGLLVASKGPLRLEQLMSYQHNTPTAFGSFQSPAATAIVAFIVGPKKDTPYEFKLYRAVEEDQ